MPSKHAKRDRRANDASSSHQIQRGRLPLKSRYPKFPAANPTVMMTYRCLKRLEQIASLA